MKIEADLPVFVSIDYLFFPELKTHFVKADEKRRANGGIGLI